MAVCPHESGCAHILSTTELHYVLDLDHIFVSNELAVQLDTSTKLLHIIVHGVVQKGADEHNARKSRQYNTLFKDGDCEDMQSSDGVYDFSRTFLRDGLPTNEEAYEGPQCMHSVRQIDTGDELHELRDAGEVTGDEGLVYFRGVPSIVTAVNVRVERFERTISAIHVTRVGDRPFSSTNVYLFRFGYFLARPAETRRKGRRFDVFRHTDPSLEHHMHLWAYPDAETRRLVDTVAGSRNALKRCLIHLTAKPFVDLIHKAYPNENDIHPLSEHRVRMRDIDLDSVAFEATADLWVVYPNHAKLEFADDTIEKSEATGPRPATYGLFSQANEYDRRHASWQERHLLLKDSWPAVESLKRTDIPVQRGHPINARVEFEGLSLASLSRTALRRLGVFGVMWAVVATISDPQFSLPFKLPWFPAKIVWNPGERFGLTVLLFLAVMLIGKVLALREPRFQRFVDA